MTEPWRGVPWVTKYLDNVSEKFVYRHAAELGGVKVGGRLMFRASEIDRFLEGNRLLPASPKHNLAGKAVVPIR